MQSDLLIIFIKNPVEGEVKTRLGASIGSTNALHIYKNLLSHTREIALRARCDRQLWYSSMIDRRDAWSSEQFDKKLQQGDDLGMRMSTAFLEAFATGYKRVVIIGSDCADLSPRHIENAFEALKMNDAVIGPSEDGGYYLLGMAEFRAELFRGIKWSTPEVFEKTTQLFREYSLSFEVMETLNDIDTIEDLKQSGLTLT